jgi:colicin import membrane protein
MSFQQSQEYVGLIPGGRDDPWTMVLFASVSLACHLAFFLIILFMPDVRPRRNFIPNVISVSMVSMPSEGTAGPPVIEPEPKAEPEAVPTAPPEPAETPEVPLEIPPEPEVSIPEPEVSIPKKEAVPTEKRQFKPKTSLKQKTKVEPVEKKVAPKTVEKETKPATKKAKPKPAPADPVADAIKRLQSRVGSTNPRGGQVGQGGVGNGAPGGQRALELMDIYRAEIPYVVQKNWAFSSQLAGLSGDLYAIVVLEIGRDGRILDIWFDEKSGNRFLDESAYKAVQKSDPLPPLPPGYPRNSYKLGLRFTPKGIQ